MRGGARNLLVAAAVAAAIAAVPAIAMDVGPFAGSSATPRKIAAKALKRAKAAQRTARAAKATATTALGRVKRLSFLADDPTAESVVLSAAGLRIHARCVAADFLEVRADTTVNNSTIHISAVRPAGLDNEVNDFQDDDFDVGEDAPLPAVAGDNDNVQGTLTYRNGSTGQVVTMTYLLEEFLAVNDCGAFGTATVA